MRYVMCDIFFIFFLFIEKYIFSLFYLLNIVVHQNKMHNTINNNDENTIIDAEAGVVSPDFSVVSLSLVLFELLSLFVFASKHFPSAPPQDLQLQAVWAEPKQAAIFSATNVYDSAYVQAFAVAQT